jgi:hypothetical protein
MVGERYRDLMDAADTIAQMKARYCPSDIFCEAPRCIYRSE